MNSKVTLPSPLEPGQVVPRRGSILLLVLAAIIIMTLTTSTFLLLMRNEHLAANYGGKHLQSQMLAESGVDYLRVFLSATRAEIEQQGGVLNNPDWMQDVLVVDDEIASYRGRFTIVAPDSSQGVYQNFRYGLENESAKLNLNTLLANEDTSDSSEEDLSPRDRLLFIPGMSDSVADAILDWLDEDDSPRVNGAEADYYQGLSPAYEPRNGPLSNLDELLQVQGVTAELLYGVDVNRNYLVEENEQPRGALAQLDNTTGLLNRGWSAYLTVYSSSRDTTADGEPKIDVNSSDLQTLYGELQLALGAAEANFIIAYRQFGAESNSAGGTSSSGGPSVGGTGRSGAGSGTSDSGTPVSAESIEIDFEKQSESTIASLLDLIGVTVAVEGTDGQTPQVISSPWTDDRASYAQGFSNLLDNVTAEPSERIVGQININQASRPVLLAIPGMTETLAEQILASRTPAADLVSGDQRHPIWLMAEGLITLDEFKRVHPHITAKGDVYSAQVIGYFEAGTARARTEVVLDRSGDQVILLSWKDLSQLGPGFSSTSLSSLAEPVE